MNRTQIVLAAILLGAAGCSTVAVGPNEPVSVQERHPISVDSQTVTLNLGPSDHGPGLSNVDRARVMSFADMYITRGHGPVTVTAPANGTGYKAAQQTAADARKALNEAGVPWSDISGASYRAAEGGGAEVVLSFTRYVATASPCGDWSDGFLRRQKNLPMKNFGCATQNNVAAMLADPRELVEMAESTPADAMYRARGVAAFRNGEDSTSERNDRLSVTTSQGQQ